jgi:predicted PurR-regulated permease PerM
VDPQGGVDMSGVRSLIISLCVVAAAAGVASAQLPPLISQGQAMTNIPVTRDDAVQRKLAIAANQQRQLEIKRDMEKMSELTQELKQYLATSSQGIMSLDAIKKAEQIEKLARSMKSKMKQVF